MKSHVSMEQKKCGVCTKDYESGTILLDRRMRQSLERHTFTGWGLCPDCQKLKDEGYIALVEVDESKSKVRPNGNMDPDGAYRTGDVIHVKVEVFTQMFTIPPTKPDGTTHAFMFVDKDVVELIRKAQQTA